MKKLLLLALAVTLSFSLASAQLVDVVYGPLVGDAAGTIITTNGAPISVEVWVRTQPGVNIVGLHMPLASNDIYVASRDGGVLGFPIDPGLGLWDDCSFLEPPDADPGGFTNQSILGVKDLIGTPDPIGGIETNGEWWMIASFSMMATEGNEFDIEHCDAFQEGDQTENHGITLAAWEIGEIPVQDITQSFACLQFTSNTDPVWCEIDTDICADAGMEVCFDLCGTDADVNDNLHIALVDGPGEYTESEGGPGGYTAGTWCGTLETSAVLTFALTDGSGGNITLEVVVTVGAIAMDIACVDGFPGATVSVPVTLHTCAFMMGGLEGYIGWDPTALTLISVTPTGRLDYGNEYWYVSPSDPCEECPDDDAVRITWISDINNGIPHAPAYPGDDPIFMLNFHVEEGLPWGMHIPITFLIPHYSDNTISDPSGYIWFRPELTDGCVNTIDPADYKGDPNMNGWFYEVGDAVLVARRLIFGPIVWTENGPGDDAIQEASGDLNNNGVVDVADLVRFINIINGTIEPPKLDPASANAEVSLAQIDGNMEVSVSSGLDIGGVLLSIDHTGIEIGTPVANGMDFLANDADGVLNVVVYSYEGNTFAAGNSPVITIPVISGEGSVEIVEASTADAYGRLLETTALVVAPVPTQYAVAQNYPNPFNARTMISFDLPEVSDVTVNIYSVTGQLVESISGHYEAGSHSITWDASDVASGVYFYKVNAGNFAQTMKMTLLK